MINKEINKPIGCTECPYAGHIESRECPDAYTEISDKCGLYKHDPMRFLRRAKNDDMAQKSNS